MNDDTKRFFPSWLEVEVKTFIIRHLCLLFLNQHDDRNHLNDPDQQFAYSGGFKIYNKEAHEEKWAAWSSRQKKASLQNTRQHRDEPQNFWKFSGVLRPKLNFLNITFGEESDEKHTIPTVNMEVDHCELQRHREPGQNRW